MGKLFEKSFPTPLQKLPYIGSFFICKEENVSLSMKNVDDKIDLFVCRLQKKCIKIQKGLDKREKSGIIGA